jgi:predicted regulator of Ras-like GTPase activity (Roadblock/LC7/MglB family)
MIAGAVSAPWLDAPLRRFVQDSRVQRAIVLHPDGKVLGQFGFSSAVEVMTACALAAAINASGKELGRQLGGRPFLGLHQGGRKQGVFMGSCAAGGKECLLLAAFDRDSTLGLVRLYFAEFRDAVGDMEKRTELDSNARDLESDLNSSLDALFGPLN